MFAWSPFPTLLPRAASIAKNSAAARTWGAPVRLASSRFFGESSTAAGIRRIEAISGDRALAEYQKSLSTLRRVAGMLNSGEDEVVAALERQFETVRQLEKQLAGLKRKAAGGIAESLLEDVSIVKEVRFVAARIDGFDREALTSARRYSSPEARFRRCGPRCLRKTAKLL